MVLVEVRSSGKPKCACGMIVAGSHSLLRIFTDPDLRPYSSCASRNMVQHQLDHVVRGHRRRALGRSSICSVCRKFSLHFRKDIGHS